MPLTRCPVMTGRSSRGIWPGATRAPRRSAGCARPPPTSASRSPRPHPPSCEPRCWPGSARSASFPRCCRISPRNASGGPAGGLAVRSQQELDRTRAAGQAVAAVLSAPDARTVTGTGAGGTATVVLSRSRGQVVFASSGLRSLERSETYELWLMGPRAVRPAGLLRPDAAGQTRPVVASPLADADRVGLTVEPASGSSQPTTDPVLLLNLPTA